jgi:hypothetical protein
MGLRVSLHGSNPDPLMSALRCVGQVSPRTCTVKALHLASLTTKTFFGKCQISVAPAWSAASSPISHKKSRIESGFVQRPSKQLSRLPAAVVSRGIGCLLCRTRRTVKRLSIQSPAIPNSHGSAGHHNAKPSAIPTSSGRIELRDGVGSATLCMGPEVGLSTTGQSAHELVSG